ncbi:ring finger domain containing protein [Nitzschia inconspicua]|uniref:Ring finger domain containing protein n=1 Tax=Nitzschia inconspicua TaxID=303405 RepID=A0A9K3PLP5_9STRA|nr:ring finger domain containing protein [Nitzschia inconspicua]
MESEIAVPPTVGIPSTSDNVEDLNIAVVPSTVRVAAREDTVEARQNMILEFLETSLPPIVILQSDENNEVGNRDNEDDDNNEDRPTNQCSLCCMCFREKMYGVLKIVAYPFMLLFTIFSLVMIVTFCIIPTMCCLTLGICAYYCVMDDPIPLHLMLHYMFNPDNDAENAFGNGASSAYPLANNRPLIQSKLIVRRLIKVTSTDEKMDESENDANNKYPRRHPGSIFIRTESKCLRFSEPVVFPYDEDNGKEKKKKRRSRRRRTGDAATNPNNGEDDAFEDTGDNSIVSGIPHHRGSGMRETSNRHLDEVIPVLIPAIRNEAEELVVAEIPSVDGSTRLTTRESLEGEAPTESDEELGNVPISVGREWDDNDDADQDVDFQGNEPHQSTAILEDDTIDQDNDAIASVCQECNDHNIAKDVSVAEEALSPRNIGDPNPPDYFGIESDSRDRHTACDICLLEYEIGDEVAWSPNMLCSHTYHKDCILDWLVRKPTCPNCRHDYTNEKKSCRG